jgi:DNA polymerase-3 subunit beta
MKVVCEHKDLNKSLSIISKAVPAKPTLPILGNVLIHFGNAKVTLTAYDLEMGVRHSFIAKTEGEGSLALPAKLLQEIVSHLPEGELTLDVDPNIRMTVRTENAEYDIHGISADEYPDFPDIKEKGANFTTNSSDLVDCLRKTTYASSKDSARTWTSGIFMVVEEKKLVLVATDGRRLALDRCPIDGRAPKEGINSLIPTKTMDDLLRILSMGYEGKVKITISKSMTQFEMGDTMIISHLLDAQFPDYQRVIPSDFKGKLSIDREKLAQAIRGVSIVAKQREGRDMAVLSTESDFLTISSHVESLGSSTQKLPVHKEGEELKVAFNYQFLLDPIQNIVEDEIELSYGSQLQPGLITIPEDDDYLYVIMPVRLTE